MKRTPILKVGVCVAVEVLEGRVLLSSGFPADPSFGNGVVAYGGPTKVQPDGKILVEDINRGGNVVRLNTDGSVDQSFNSAGAVVDWGVGTARLDNGKLLRLEGGLTLYNADGSVDTSFGNGGTVSQFYFDSPLFASFQPADVAVQGNQIIVGGDVTRNDQSPQYQNGDNIPPVAYAVERFNSDGSLDTSFGMHWAYDSAVDSATLVRVAVTAQGQIIAAGYDTDDNADLIDFGTDGPDGTMGVNHRMLGNGAFYDMTLEPDGTIVAVGTTYYNENAYVGVFNPDFSLRQDIGGYYSPSQPAVAIDNARYVAVAPDKTILVSSDSDQMVRLIPDNATVPAGVITGSIVPAVAEDVQWQAYVDLNNNGIYDTGEPTSLTDGNGFYAIGGLAPGSYIVREVRQPGYVRTQPPGAWPAGYYAITLTAGAGQRGLDFSNELSPFHGSIKLDQGPGKDPSPLAGATVYIDTNNNGLPDAGEPTATSDDSGYYQFDSLPAGNSVARLEVPQGTAPVSPPTGSFTASNSPNYPYNFELTQIPGQSIDLSKAVPAPTVVTTDATLTTYGMPADPTFGDNGLASAFPGPMSIQSDGKILIDKNGSGDIIRLNANGTIDNTFNPAGVIDTWQKGATTRQPDGKLLVVQNGGVTRFNADGSIDTTFGVNGTANNFPLQSGLLGFDPQLVALAGSDVVVAGVAPRDQSGVDGQQTESFAVVWLNADGTADARYVMSAAPLLNQELQYVGGAQATCIISDSNSLDVGVAGYVANQIVYEATFRPGNPYSTSFRPLAAGVPIAWAGAIGAAEAMVGRDPATGRSWCLVGRGAFMISAPGRAGDTGASFTDVDQVAVTAGGDVVVSNSAGQMMRFLAPLNGFTFSPPPHSIYGMVGLFPGAPQWQVYLDLNNDGAYEQGEPTAFTDANGNYDIHGLAAGDYRVREVSQPGYVQATPQGAWPGGFYDVTVPVSLAGPDHPYFDFINVACPISGRVTQTSSGGSSTAVPGAIVYVDLNNDNIDDDGDPTAVTDAGGLYAFGTLPTAASYTVRVIAPAGISGTLPAAQVVSVSANQPATNVDFVFAPPSSVGGGAGGGTDTGGTGGGSGNTGSTGGSGASGSSGGTGGSSGGSTGGTVGQSPGGGTPPPAPPTTIAGFKSLLASDRAAINTLKRKRASDIAELKHTLRTDAKSLRAAQRQLKSSQHAIQAAQKNGDTAAGESASASAAAATQQIDSLQATSQSDQDTLANLSATDDGQIASARQTLAADLLAYRQFRKRP